MKVSVKITRTVPLGVEEIEMEDVESYIQTDTELLVKYNIGVTEVVKLSSGTGNITEWFTTNIYSTKTG